MTPKKYNFIVDEAKPKIPPPKEFSAVLGSVKAQIPWYAKSLFWGGAASVIVASAAVTWWFSSGDSIVPASEQKAQLTSQQQQNVTRDEPEEITIPTKKLVTNYGLPIVQEETSKDWPWPKTDPFDFNRISSASIVYASEEAKVVNRWGWQFAIPYDTLHVNTSYLPYTFATKKGSRVFIPANTILNEDGTLAKGEVLVLYREFLDQADMLVSSMYLQAQNSKSAAPFINNGAFEIQIKQGEAQLKLDKGTPMLVYFNTLDPALVFSGFYARESSDIWTPLFFGNTAMVDEANSQKNYLVDSRIPRRRNFWQWLGDVFHGRKLQWDTFKTVQNGDYGFKDYGIYRKERIFEIAEPGYFGSGRTMDMGFTTLGKLNVSCESNQSLEGNIYQVFLNTNMVRRYSLVNGKSAVQYSESDRCMLIAIVENSNFVAVLDPNSFDHLVKGNFNEVNITMKLEREEIKSLDDLKSLIKRHSAQRARKI